MDFVSKEEKELAELRESFYALLELLGVEIQLVSEPGPMIAPPMITRRKAFYKDKNKRA